MRRLTIYEKADKEVKTSEGYIRFDKWLENLALKFEEEGIQTEFGWKENMVCLMR